MRETGTYETLGTVKYFVPFSPANMNPPFTFDKKIVELHGEASFYLGQLREMSRRIPDISRFVKAYIIKEALLSSDIEGIHTTILEVFTHGLQSTRSKLTKDTQLVLNYTKALDEAFFLIRDQGYPLVNRVILKAHEVLMTTGEGEKANPGHFREQSVRVGELVPPPAPQIPPLIDLFRNRLFKVSNYRSLR